MRNAIDQGSSEMNIIVGVENDHFECDPGDLDGGVCLIEKFLRQRQRRYRKRGKIWV